MVINETFTKNIPADADMSDKVQQSLALGEEAQAAIDNYKKLRAIYDKPVYQTKVTQIDNNLIL